MFLHRHVARNMKRHFKFMHVADVTAHDVTSTTIAMDYNNVTDNEAAI